MRLFLFISSFSTVYLHSCMNIFVCFLHCYTDRDVGFAATSYTFIENEGTGAVNVTGPSNFPGSLSVSVVGGESS